MKRSPLKRKTPMPRGNNGLSRTTFKRSAKRKQRIEGHHNQRYLDACKGEPCYLQVPYVCKGSQTIDTVVACHSNQGKHGKGMGIKARDEFSVPGCVDCHSWLDQNSTGADKATKFAVFDKALALWVPVRTRKLNGGHLDT